MIWSKRKSQALDSITPISNGLMDELPEGKPQLTSNGVSAAEATDNVIRSGQAAPDDQVRLEKATADELQISATFARIVSVLMRSPQYKHYTLGDLEWLDVPSRQLTKNGGRMNG